MRKKIICATISGILFIACVVILILVLCGVIGDRDSFRATRIQVDTQNAQTQFYVGENFNSNGLVVTAINVEGEEKVVENYSVDSSAFNSGETGTYTINVYYQDVYTTYEVDVVSAEEFLIGLLSSEETKNFAQSVNSISIDQGEVNATYRVLDDEFYIYNGINIEQWGRDGYLYSYSNIFDSEVYSVEPFNESNFLKGIAGDSFEVQEGWTYAQNLAYAFSLEPIAQLQANEVRFDSVTVIGNDYIIWGRQTVETSEHPYSVRVDARNHYVKEWIRYSDDQQDVVARWTYYYNTSVSIPLMPEDAVWQANVGTSIDEIKNFLLTEKTRSFAQSIISVRLQSAGEDYKVFTNNGVYSLITRDGGEKEEVWQTATETVVKATTADGTETVTRVSSSYETELSATEGFVYNSDWTVAQNYYYNLFFKFFQATGDVQEFAVSQEGNLLTIQGGTEMLVIDLSNNKIVNSTESIYEGTATFTLEYNGQTDMPQMP